MKNLIIKYKLPITLLFYTSYHYLFWQHDLGINWVIFNLTTVALLYLLNPKTFFKTSRIILLVGFLLTGLAFIWHYSTVAMWAHATSLFLLIAAMQENELLLLLYIGGKGFQNYMTGIWYFFKSVKVRNVKVKNKKLQFFWRQRGYTILVPFVFIALFFIIFMIANPYFADLVFNTLTQIEVLWNYLMEIISVSYFFFMLFGLWWIVHLFIKSPHLYFSKLQEKAKVYILRIRNKSSSMLSFGMMSLKAEYLSGIVMIVGINVLLLILNILDIKNIWIFWDGSLAPQLKNILHQGTYWLIASILLSIAILIYYFRKNLNFYPNNHWLKRLAYLWIFQNVILAISVAIRCFYYIEEYGLAYKRIGVLIFLALVFFGLGTMFLKIQYKKSFYYLWHRNTWAVFMVFVGMSLVDWDSLIVRHNLKYLQSKKIDLGFTVSRSDKTMPIVYHYLNQIEERHVYEPFFPYVYEVDKNSGISINEYFQKRIKDLQKRKRKEGWQSWNWADAVTLNFFKENP